MDLWIRSQDRKEMTKPNYIRIIERTNHCLNRDEYIIQDEEYCDLGTYKTEERALEVLDEIQNILMPKYIVDTSSIKEGKSWVENEVIFSEYNANTIVEQLSTCVYEMPLE